LVLARLTSALVVSIVCRGHLFCSTRSCRLHFLSTVAAAAAAAAVLSKGVSRMLMDDASIGIGVSRNDCCCSLAAAPRLMLLLSLLVLVRYLGTTVVFFFLVVLVDMLRPAIFRWGARKSKSSLSAISILHEQTHRNSPVSVLEQWPGGLLGECLRCLVNEDQNKSLPSRNLLMSYNCPIHACGLQVFLYGRRRFKWQVVVFAVIGDH
jgi:hypothetical protein